MILLGNYLLLALPSLVANLTSNYTSCLPEDAAVALQKICKNTFSFQLVDFSPGADLMTWETEKGGERRLSEKTSIPVLST